MHTILLLVSSSGSDCVMLVPSLFIPLSLVLVDDGLMLAAVPV